MFLMTSDKATVDGAAIVVPGDAAIVVFSDRPHRIARTLPGGVMAFANFYARSNFVADPPNATFAGSTAEGIRKSVRCWNWERRRSKMARCDFRSCRQSARKRRRRRATMRM